jgi:hypothetical protein
MLNLKLREKIDVLDYRILYDTRLRLSSYTIRNEVRNYIKTFRAKWNSSEEQQCPLEQKFQQFGNSGGWAKFKSRELDKMIYDQHKPIPKDFIGQLRSIEFEVIFKGEQSMLDFAKEVRKTTGLIKDVTIKDDGSLRPDEDDRNGLCKEVVITYKSGDEQKVHAVCAALKGRAYINNSCGTHVHFDMRNADEKTVRQYGRRLARCVPALKCLLPKSRRNNQYCAQNINDIGGGGRSNRHARYTFVNLQAYTKYQTIEVRGHSATIKADKILNWIKICEKIMMSRIRTKTEEITDSADLIKLFKLEGNLAEYVKERYNKFNPHRDFPAPEGPPVAIRPAPGVVIPTIATAPVEAPVAPGALAPLPARFGGGAA